MQDSTFHAQQVVTRFLLPFRFAQEKASAVRQALCESQWSERIPNRNYRADFTPDFLGRCFGVVAEDGAARSNLFQWDSNRGKTKPGQLFNVDFKGETFRSALWNQDGRDIELFLSDQGVGVFSITICFAESRDSRGGNISLDQIKSFNYSLSQDPGRKSLCALLTRAEGEPYDPISLKQFAEDSLVSIRRKDFQWRSLFETTQLIPYTVIRLSDEYSFNDFTSSPGNPQCRELITQASLLAQVAEAPHPLPTVEDPGAIVRIYHTDELFAVSSMGAAVLLTDIGTQFDNQKLQDRLDKYFVCFLAALSQRLRLRQLLEDASNLAALVPGSLRDQKLESLRTSLLATASRSELIEVSTRDTINRFFLQCQQAHRVPQALALVQRTIADMDASLQAEKQSSIAAEQQKLALEQNYLTKHMAATQTKVEWIETFLISFYAAELVDLLGKDFHLAQSYLSVCVLLAMFGGGIVCALMLKPWDPDKADGWPPPPAFRNTVVIIGVLLMLFLVAGKRYFAEPISEASNMREQWQETQTKLNELTSAIKAEREAILKAQSNSLPKGNSNKAPSTKSPSGHRAN
jgi:hypothetical protein